MKILSFIVFIFALFADVAYVRAQTLTVRNAHSMVYDSRFSRVLLFGGADEKKVYGDLWVLEKRNWKLLKREGPTPRTFAGFVYDEANKRSILFGGSSVLFGNKTNPGQMLGDTWSFKTRGWEKLYTPNSPGPRASAAIAYDSQNKRIVMFGGYRMEDGKVKRLSDTWEFKNDDWKKINDSGPSARVGASMVYDPRTKKMILFGGSTDAKEYGAGSGETWILDGSAWTKIEIDQPPNIFDSTMVLQTDKDRILRFGGWNGTGRINETWIYKTKWSKLKHKTSPPPRNHSSMVYDFRTKRAILFGGHDGPNVLGDLWIFRGGRWFKGFGHDPINRIDNGH